MHIEIHESATTAGLAAAFTSVLTAQCQRLAVGLKVWRGGAAASAKDHIALVFAQRGSTWTSKQNRTFEQLVNDGIRVLPVISNPPAARFLPEPLAPVNAFIRHPFGAQWPASLADEVLSMAWLRRRTRKVFISYRRIDSECVASQLYDRLNHLGYETFLDEASVRRGMDVQRELKWWLNDADLLLVLASPRFPLSKWCMDELTFCQQRFIGVAAIQWPKEIYGGQPRLPFPQIRPKTRAPVITQATMPDQQLLLKPKDFQGLSGNWRRVKHVELPGRELTPAALDRVIALCARQRAVAIRQRMDDLVPLARSILSASGAVVQATGLGDLDVRDPNGQRTFVRVLPFRPQPESLQQSCTDAAGYGEAGCFYAENDPYDARAEALRWLTKGQRLAGAGTPTCRLWACCGGVLL